MIDNLFYADDDSGIENIVGSLNAGAELRQARLFMSGTMYKYIGWKSQFDFTGGDADIKDMWMSFKELPFHNELKVGHFKEPISLEDLASSKYITFMERALPNVFTSGRNTGIQLKTTPFKKKMTGAIGFFRNVDDFGEGEDGSGGGEYNVTARITGLPVYEDKGRKLVHLGLGYSHRLPPDDTARFRARPEVHIGPHFVDTGSIKDVQAVDVFNAEFAAVMGSWSVQAEYMYTTMNMETSGDPKVSGVYGYISYFFTGEHRRYKTSTASFDKVIPISPYRDGKGGRGAWEIAARVSHLDLNDEPVVKGGELTNFTAALNWYLSANARIMFNYVLASIDETGSGKDNSEQVNMFNTRVQLFW